MIDGELLGAIVCCVLGPIIVGLLIAARVAEMRRRRGER